MSGGQEGEVIKQTFIGQELQELNKTEHELGLDQSPFMRHAQKRARRSGNDKAHVNEMGIVMRFDSLADNLSSEAWESLLDELKSHYIPSFYQYGKRLHVAVRAEGKLRAVVYFTPQAVSMDEAIKIRKQRSMELSVCVGITLCGLFFSTFTSSRLSGRRR